MQGCVLLGHVARIPAGGVQLALHVVGDGLELLLALVARHLFRRQLIGLVGHLGLLIRQVILSFLERHPVRVDLQVRHDGLLERSSRDARGEVGRADLQASPGFKGFVQLVGDAGHLLLEFLELHAGLIERIDKRLAVDPDLLGRVAVVGDLLDEIVKRTGIVLA